jgi:hypothetical protein
MGRSPELARAVRVARQEVLRTEDLEILQCLLEGRPRKILLQEEEVLLPEIRPGILRLPVKIQESLQREFIPPEEHQQKFHREKRRRVRFLRGDVPHQEVLRREAPVRNDRRDERPIRGGKIF